MVAIRRKRVRGPLSLRTRKVYDTTKVGASVLAIFVAVYCLSKLTFLSNSETSNRSTLPDEGSQHTCGLWLMESSFNPGENGLYAGVDTQSAGERVSEPGMLVPIIDLNTNEWSPLFDFVLQVKISRELQLDNRYLTDVFAPGIEALGYGKMVQCSRSDEHGRGLANIEVDRKELQDSVGVHRSTHPTAGSFTYHSNYGYQSRRPLLAGEELILPCPGNTSQNTTQDERQQHQLPQRVSLETLARNGVCVDNLSVGPSTLPGVGRGAFTKDSVGKGESITFTPVIHFDRSQMQIVAQMYKPGANPAITRKHGIVYSDRVAGQQLLLNYCFGHPASNVLLLPIAPVVNYINHHHTKANAAISSFYGADDVLTADPMMTVDIKWNGLTLDIVALRDILPGEEILIDYGDAWVQAWDKHVNKWKPQGATYMAAADYRRIHAGAPVRTSDEQLSDPYPDNLRTACYLTQKHGIGFANDLDCLRLCGVKERTGTGTDTRYTAIVYPMGNVADPDYCGNALADGFSVQGLPWNAVQVVDAVYSTDSHLGTAFRHEIGVPGDIFPQTWMAADPKPMGDFIAPPLKIGELSSVRWIDTGDIVTPNAYQLGLGKRVGATLLDYCNKLGITEGMRRGTAEGNTQPINSQVSFPLGGDRWNLQRPSKKWLSDMHWLSPGDEKSHQSILQALGAAGFDEMLKSIGESLGLDGLAVFQLTFIAVSHCSKGNIHSDVLRTGNKTFNIIIPLILANETGPEQEVIETDINGKEFLKVGRYRNSYDTALLVGDGAYVSDSNTSKWHGNLT
jgi:hypothetical protein